MHAPRAAHSRAFLCLGTLLLVACGSADGPSPGDDDDDDVVDTGPFDTDTDTDDTSDTDEPDPDACERDMPELGSPSARAATADDPAVAALASDLDVFGGDLLAALEPTEVNGSLSTLSLVGMFSVLLPGADAPTTDALTDILRLSQPQADHHAALSALLDDLAETERGWGFEWGAGFWHRPSLTVEPDWAAAVQPYGVIPTPLDFQADNAGAIETLNRWVEDHTRCLIPDFYPESYDFSNTVHVAIQAMALEALWETPFDGAFTAPRPFHRADGTTVDVEVMDHQSFRGMRADIALGDDEATLLRLPYKGGDLTMYVVMPDDVLDTPALLQHRSAALSAVDDLVVNPSQSLGLRLPRWATTSRHDLRPALDALGYEPLVSADMPDLCAGCLMPDIIRQVVVVLVDEEGTRAAAASSGESNDSVPEYTDVDRPFLWFLRDDVSGVVLWEGWVGDPSQ